MSASELRILLLEDVPEEAELLERELRKAGLSFTARRVQTREAFATELERFAPDLVLADSKLPAFDGRGALELVKERYPRIPVIMVTGALGDEAAVELLIAGARDYVLKDRLARLGSAVQRVLREDEERRSRERLEQALHEATREERKRLAQELHDGLGQELTGLAMLADGLVRRASRSTEPVAPELTRLAATAREAIKVCRDIAHGLSPFGGTPGGLPEALRALAARLGGPPGPSIALALEMRSTLSITQDASEHLYRIAQEAVANALKHSGARNIQIRLHVDERCVRLCVLDDGRGEVPHPLASRGMGMRTMWNRAQAIGGRLSIGAREEGGTAVVCDVPQVVPITAR